MFRKIYRLILIALHLSWGAFMIAFLVGPNPEHRTIRDWGLINQWMRVLCKIIGLRITVTGTPPKQPSLLAANHISWHDIAVLQSLIATGFIAKYEIRGWPLIGWLAHRANTLFIRRGHRDSAQQIKRAMQPRFANCQNIMIFPEGTTSDGSTVLPFRSRLFEAATELHIPIQPVAIHYEGKHRNCQQLAFIDDESFLTHLWKTLDEPYIDVQVHFCPLIHTNNGHNRRELGKQAEESVATALAELKTREQPN